MILKHYTYDEVRISIQNLNILNIVILMICKLKPNQIHGNLF